MKSYTFIPSLMAGLLAITLTGCSSSGSSYTPDKAANKTQQNLAKEKTEKEQLEQERIAKEKAENERLENERIAKEKAENERLEQERIAKEKAENERLENERIAKEKAENERLENERLAQEKAKALNWRDFSVISSDQGGDKYNPEVKENGDVLYSSGPIVLLKDNKPVRLTDESLKYERDFFKKGDIDPSKVQRMIVTDSSGKQLGEFQFVNQQYSSYATFISEKPANEYGATTTSEPLAFYTAQASTKAQLEAQKGSFDYIGKAIGYQGGVKGSTPTQEANADINFKVDFDAKTISGKIDNRFDNLGFNSRAFVTGYDDDDNEIYIKEYTTYNTRPLILNTTKIEVNEKGIASFGQKGVTDKNAGILLDDGKYLGVSDFGGIFSGPNLEEVVGQIGGGEERITFGAAKQSK